MQYKNNTKLRYRSVQGLRSFKDTLPKNIKKVILHMMIMVGLNMKLKEKIIVEI